MFDMSKGYMRLVNKLKPDAVPPDGVEKLDYDVNDWEMVEEYVAYTPERLAQVQKISAASTLPDRLDTVEASQNDIVLALADIIGGADNAS